jgi:hypothetical protein
MESSFFITILQVFVVLASGFLIAYVRKKANNYADKKDLQELTRIVEREKSKYAADLSFIKAQLDLASGNRKSYREKEVDAISEFYTVCNWLIYDFLNLDLTWFSSKHYELISKMSTDFFENIKKLQVAKGKFDLFVGNLELRSAAHQLHITCIDYTSQIQLFILRLKYSLEKEISFRDEVVKYMQDAKRDTSEEHELIEREKLIKSEIEAYSSEYKRLRSEKHDKLVVQSIATFESSARVYLSTI